jgi:hypothetical protein
MTVAINRPRPKETAMDKIAKALQIAIPVVNTGLKFREMEIDQQKANAATKMAEGQQARAGESHSNDMAKAQREAASYSSENDPANPAAQTLRDEAAKRGIQVPKDMTVAQAKQLGLSERFKEMQRQQHESRLQAVKDGKETKPSGDQSKAALFGKRMEQAEGVFDNLTKMGFDRTSGFMAASAVVPTNKGKPKELQQQEQAERNFINAVLRRESGASISPTEFESAEKQYFPRWGDDPDTVEQKRQNRLLAIEGMRAESGPAWAKIAPSAGAPLAVGKRGDSLIPEAHAKSERRNVVFEQPTKDEQTEAQRELIRRRGMRPPKGR